MASMLFVEAAMTDERQPGELSQPSRSELYGDVSARHFVVLHTVAFCAVPFDILAHNAMMRDPGTHRRPPLPLDTWEEVVRGFLDKGWLRCLDEAAMREINSSLTDVALVCDEEAMPRVGDCDFTLVGAQAYKAVLSAKPDPEWRFPLEAPAARVVSRPEASLTEVECYALQPCSVQDALYGTGEGWGFELAERPVLSTTQPETVGPWCSRWWNQHPRGYRFKAVFGT
jgi:hypothetical protein